MGKAPEFDSVSGVNIVSIRNHVGPINEEKVLPPRRPTRRVAGTSPGAEPRGMAGVQCKSLGCAVCKEVGSSCSGCLSGDILEFKLSPNCQEEPLEDTLCVDTCMCH